MTRHTHARASREILHLHLYICLWSDKGRGSDTNCPATTWDHAGLPIVACQTAEKRKKEVTDNNERNYVMLLVGQIKYFTLCEYSYALWFFFYKTWISKTSISLKRIMKKNLGKLVLHFQLQFATQYYAI